MQEELVYLLLNCDSLSNNHTYKVTLTEMGERKDYTINDTILCVKSSSNKLKPLFTHSSGNDVWALILEKAYAKMFGLYSSILEGKPYELIYSFMDGEYKVYSLKSEKLDSIWKFMVGFFSTKEKVNEVEEVREYMNIDLNERRKVILVSTQKLMDNGPKFSNYIIDKVKEIEISTTHKVKYVRLKLIDEDHFLKNTALDNWTDNHEIQLGMD